MTLPPPLRLRAATAATPVTGVTESRAGLRPSNTTYTPQRLLFCDTFALELSTEIGTLVFMSAKQAGIQKPPIND